MQNLMSCPKGQCMVPRMLYKYLVTNSHSKKPTYNLKRSQRTDVVIHRKIKNTFIPLSYNVLKQMSVDLEKIDFVLQQKLFHHRYSDPFLQFNRNFSTSSKNAQNSPNQSSKEPNKDTNKKSDKDSKQNFNEIVLNSVKLMIHLFLLFYILFQLGISIRKDVEEEYPAFVSWNEFVYQMLAKGEVRKITVSLPDNVAIIELHPGAVINGKISTRKMYHMNLPNIDEFEQKLRKMEAELGIKYDNYVPVEYNRNRDTIKAFVHIAIALLLVSFFLNARKQLSSLDPRNVFSKMQKAQFTLVEPHVSSKGVRFSDVAGLSEAKTEVMEFVDYLKNPSHYKALGAKVPKGALFLGPPGCGKTLLAKAVATEAGVPFFSVNGTDFVQILGGLGPARVRDLFKEAKKRAPSIIYIDEIDTIGKNRSSSKDIGGDEEGERTLNQLLVEMDGMGSSEDVIVLASTNRHTVLDRALLRPGRFDRKILIDLPTTIERKEIFETHLKKLSLERPAHCSSGILAELTPRCSGADIANICNESALYAARFKKKTVSIVDLLCAVNKLVGGVEKKNYVITSEEKRVAAYRRAGETLLNWILEHTRNPIKVSMTPRTNQALGFLQRLETQSLIPSREEILDEMTAMLGPRVAEHMIFNTVSEPVQSNVITEVTKLAYRQVNEWGMSPTIGLVSYKNMEQKHQKKPYSKHFGNLMDQEARHIISSVHDRAQKLLLENKHKLIILAEALLKKEELTYKDIEDLIGPPPFKKKQEEAVAILNAFAGVASQNEQTAEKQSPIDDGPVSSQTPV